MLPTTSPTAKKPFRTEWASGLLSVYSGNQPVDAAAFQKFLDLWAEQLSLGERFGVVLVYEAYESAREGRDAAEEDRFTRVMGGFRRHYREEVNRLCSGFARVFPAAWLAGMDAEKAAQYKEKTRRFAEYMYGVRGADFTALDEAKAWLASTSQNAPLALGETETRSAGRTGFFYGSTTGTTEFVAEKMRDAAEGMGLELNPINISTLKDPRALLKHDQLILGIPTWNVGQLQDDWLRLYPKLDTLDFSGKQAALFGVGDQLGYPDNFLDAMGTLAQKLQERGAELVGFWPTDGYSFTASKAQVGDRFMGLGVDDYNQEDLTEGRVARWLEQVQREFSTSVGLSKRLAESVS